MKTIKNLTFANQGLLIIALLILCVSIQSCKKDSPADSPSDVVSKQISSGLWKVKSVTVDNTDQTDLFKNFTLQYGLTTYTATNGTPVWPASGTWKFKDDTAAVITRDDGIDITIESISDREFIYSLKWTKTTYAGGKVKSVNGLHRFDMVR